MYKRIDAPKIIGVVFGLVLALALTGFLSSIPPGDLSNWVFVLGTSSGEELIEFAPMIESYMLRGVLLCFIATFTASVIFDFGGYFMPLKRWRTRSILLYFVMVVIVALLLFPWVVIQQNLSLALLLILAPLLAMLIGRVVGEYLYDRYRLADANRRDIGLACLITFLVALGVARAI